MTHTAEILLQKKMLWQSSLINPIIYHFILKSILNYFNHGMCCSDFPYVVAECGYKEGKDAAFRLAQQLPLPSSDLEWIMGKTVDQLFKCQWTS